MSKKIEPTPPVADDAAADAVPAAPMGRRAFMQVGLMGLAGASCASLPDGPASTPPGGSTPPGAPSRPTDVTPAQLQRAGETWNEPWVWRPSLWPGQQLQLNVVENQNPGPIIGFGNPDAQLFSYNGQTPGPTIRMRGDETLKVKLRNHLGLNAGSTAIGPNPDPATLTPDLKAAVCEYVKGSPGTPTELAAFKPQLHPDAVHAIIGNDVREDFCLGEHTNGLHAAHVTNMHTHGLHVRPYRNPDGTHSDNVILRVIPQPDFNKREDPASAAACEFLRAPDETNFLQEDEQAGEADYEFRLGDVQRRTRAAENERRAAQNPPLPPLPPQPHPPGTHWYHPHAHGATHNQVSSGMAGFLVVEGDVDEAINRRLTGQPDPDPTLKTGAWDYRERLMLVQRVLNQPKDPDAETLSQQADKVPTVLVNGNLNPPVLTMRPGAVERWRVLNGSVDGRGFKRIMVLKGLYQLQDFPAPAGPPSKRLVKYQGTSPATRWTPYTTIEADKQGLYLLALDGVTLVTETGEYTIRDLSQQNAGTTNPLAGPENSNQNLLNNYQNVFRDGDSLRNTWVRPNEVYMGLANRADVFFKAPALEDTDGDIYTIVAKAVVVHADNYQQALQANIGNSTLVPGPQDIVIGYLVVRDTPNEEPISDDFNVMSLRRDLPPAPPYLQPITEDELRTSRDAGTFRTRTVAYSGWGSADFPLVTNDPSDPSAANFQTFIDNNPDLRKLVYDEVDGVDVLIPSNIRSMAIDGRKFNPTDPDRPRMLVETAEEWALYNDSGLLWGDTTGADQPGQYLGHFRSYPITRAEGQQRFASENTFQIVTKGVDHPFHMHQNPFWVLRIEIPDENGDLHNILDAPQWMDAIWIPRHRGRVVFRARFPDFVGTYVHHCHILLHEDNGMMTPVEVTPFEDDANFEVRRQVANPRMSSSEVSAIYPRRTLDEMYVWSCSFVDTNHATGQTYPGFLVVPPSLS